MALTANIQGQTSSALNTSIDWEVSTDTNPHIAVTGSLAKACKLGTPFMLAPEIAIQACDRYFFIDGKPNNPEVLIKAWLDDIRLAVSTLWTFDPKNNTFSHNLNLNLSAEHFSRSGEMFAQGMAIEFLAQRLGVPRQKLFFKEGSEARPDFVLRKKNKHARGILKNGLWGLEVRLRASTATVHADEQLALDKKKANKTFKGVLAIYLMHGVGSHGNGLSHTRIHVVDPSRPGKFEVPVQEILPGVLSYYITMTSQIGLWEYRDHLVSSLAFLESKEFVLSESQNGPRLQFLAVQVRTGVQREVLGRTFRGREFNDLLFDFSGQFNTIEERDAARAKVRARMLVSDFGVYYFRGLDIEVLRLIEENRWIDLANYVGPTLNDENSWVRADGVAFQSRKVQPGSVDALDIAKSIC